MLGCVPLGPLSGLHPDEEMLLLWVQGGTIELFHLVCAYFPELQGWDCWKVVSSQGHGTGGRWNCF